jgi:hypothetical protein
MEQFKNKQPDKSVDKKTLEELIANSTSSTSGNEMKTMVSTLNSLVKKGFVEDFHVVEEGIKSMKSDKVYQPEQIKIVDFYRFEGTSDPADESILFAVETDDGVKGTLVDSFGPMSDERITAFIEKVEEISKAAKKK